MINIAVVESPFQFWMAREYQEQSKSRLDFKFIVRGLIPEHKILFQENLLNSNPFKYYPSQNSFLTLFNILKITLLYRNKVKTLVIPFYYSIFYKLCINAINPIEVVYVDDGTHTIEASKNFEDFLYKKIDAKFFSIFKECAINKKFLITNNLPLSKSFLSKPSIHENNEIPSNIWVGNSLVPDYLSRSRYIDCMRDSGVENEGLGWIYFASRTETISDIEKIKEAFSKIKIIKPSVNLEIHLIKNNIYFNKLRGFMSTCFFTLKILYHNQNIDFEIIYPAEFNDDGVSDRDYKDANKRQRLFYKYADQNGFKLKDFN